ncbi:MAG TPA: sigma-70 family RNA polymerase sigma factor [Kofleriaceae bacterium]|nr:sigma-70 family RNA polymerase sigma factor [Kofleriaceae bacterium]
MPRKPAETPATSRLVRKPDVAPKGAVRKPSRHDEFAAECLPHQPEMYGVALRLTRSPDDAKDLVQETLMRAMCAWSRFEPGSNVRAWLLRILTNSFINGYRKRRRHARFATERPGDALSALYGEPRDQVPHPVEEKVAHELGDEVSAALGTLAPDYREVVERADLRGERYRDIADALDVPIGTVMSRLFRARRQLETQLEDYAADDYGIRKAA